MNREIISLKNLSKCYNIAGKPFYALKEINLSFGEGEFTGIVGPSGSGKTTLLNIIGSLDSPSSGEAIVLEKNISSLNHSESARLRNYNIGFIFQVFNLLPVYTVYENVEFALLLQNFSQDERKKLVLQALKWVDLENHKDKKPDKLSGGESQRVAIARAIVKKPKILLADEPTANLDAENAHSILKTMKKINKELDTTFIFTTQDEKVKKYLNRTNILKDRNIEKETKK